MLKPNKSMKKNQLQGVKAKLTSSNGHLLQSQPSLQHNAACFQQGGIIITEKMVSLASASFGHPCASWTDVREGDLSLSCSVVYKHYERGEVGIWMIRVFIFVESSPQKIVAMEDFFLSNSGAAGELCSRLCVSRLSHKPYRKLWMSKCCRVPCVGTQPSRFPVSHPVKSSLWYRFKWMSSVGPNFYNWGRRNWFAQWKQSAEWQMKQKAILSFGLNSSPVHLRD